MQEVYGRESDLDARIGADVCITRTHPQKDHKNRAKVFVLYLQIKLLYADYNQYLATINSKKPKIEWSDKDRQMSEHIMDLERVFFGTQYKSQRKGDYFGKYQLLQLQSRRSSNTTERYAFKLLASGNSVTLAQVARVAASYRVLDSTKSSGTWNTAKNVSLVPVQSFRMANGLSFQA